MNVYDMDSATLNRVLQDVILLLDSKYMNVEDITAEGFHRSTADRILTSLEDFRSLYAKKSTYIARIEDSAGFREGDV